MTNPLSLASGVLPEFGAVTVIEAVCAAGFDAAGIWVEPGEWSAADTRASRAALEFGIFTEVKNLAKARTIVAAVAHPLAAILIDPIHADRCGSTVAEIAAVDPALRPYAQFCDARGARPDRADFDAIIIDAIDLREQCGEGALPLTAMLAALPKNLPLSIELRSRALREAYADPFARARLVAGTTRGWRGGSANLDRLLSGFSA